MTGNEVTVSLLICDDHKVLTDALSTVVGLDPSLSLIAAPVHTPEEGVALAQDQLPDVVLMDIMFKGSEMTGIEATRLIKERSPSTMVVIVTATTRCAERKNISASLTARAARALPSQVWQCVAEAAYRLAAV